MGTCIYTVDSECIRTTMPYEKLKSALLASAGKAPYVEVPGIHGNNYLIKVDNITCIEQELPGNWEEKQ